MQTAKKWWIRFCVAFTLIWIALGVAAVAGLVAVFNGQ